MLEGETPKGIDEPKSPHHVTDSSPVPEQADYLETNRRRLAELVQSLFMGVDRKVTQSIGFNGNILEELRKMKPGTQGTNTEEVDQKLKQHINKDDCTFDLKNPRIDRIVKYVVDYSIINGSVSLTPKIYIQKPRGSVTLEVLREPKYDRVLLQRAYYDPDDKHSHTRTVRTYILPKNPGNPDIPLEIENRQNYQIRMLYGNIQKNGDVDLINGQTISILPSSYATISTGKYVADNRTIAWKKPESMYESRTTPKVSNDGDMLVINTNTDTYSFPTTTNLYDEIRAGVSEIKNLILST